MEYIVHVAPAGNAVGAVSIKHSGYEMKWNMSTYNRFKLNDPTALFKEVNEFWAKQPKEKQDEVFLIYWNIYQILEDPNNVMTLTVGADIESTFPRLREMYNKYISEFEKLPPTTEESDPLLVLQRRYVTFYMSELYKCITTKDAVEIVNKMDIVYARTMSEAVPGKDEVYPSSGRTHTRSDYNALAALAIRLRPALPVFGQCMAVYQDRRRSSLRESAVIEQLSGTDIFEMPAAIKLKEFMDASLNEFKLSAVTTINGGIGRMELAYWCLAKALYRRVACGEINSSDGESSIVTNVFNFIEKSVLESVRRQFGPANSKDRPSERGGSKGEDNQSIIEGIKAREEITRGRRRMVNVFARNVMMYVNRIDSTVPEALVNELTELTPQRLMRQPHPVAVGLAMWVLSSAEVRFGDKFGGLGLHRNYDYLRREEAPLYLGAAQAVLEHWGYYELAALFDAIPEVQNGVIPVAAMWAHENFSDEIIRGLVELFPYEIPGTKKNPPLEERNYGARDVRDMLTKISLENWVVKTSRYDGKIVKDRDGFLLFQPGSVNRLAGLLIRCCSPR